MFPFLAVALLAICSRTLAAFLATPSFTQVRTNAAYGRRTITMTPTMHSSPQNAGFGFPIRERRKTFIMSEAGFGSKSKGSVKVGVKEKEAVKVSPKEKEQFEVEWRVLLHNDDVHTFDYVSRRLAETIPTLTRSKAWECTLAAHSNDFSTLAICTKQSAEDYCMKLQKAGLTISVAPDSNFQKSEQ